MTHLPATTNKDKWVYLCHPVSGIEPSQLDTLVQAAGEFIVSKGFVPVSSVKMFGSFLDNKKDYDKALLWCMDLILVCKQVWVFGDYMSYGMKREVEYATRMGIPVKFAKKFCVLLEVEQKEGCPFKVHDLFESGLFGDWRDPETSEKVNEMINAINGG